METRATSFGEFLQRKREESRMTLRKLADSLGFSAPFLSDVEKGRRNPPDLAKLEQIAEIVIRYDGYVITDEVYEHIVYEPHRHTYISTLPGMWERTISCSSLSKTYSITGWRLGYVIAPDGIIDRVKKVHDFLTVGAAAPLMEAATVGLCFPDRYYQELQAHYTHMKSLFCDGLRQFGLDFTEPQGAYYVMLDVSKYGVKDDLHFCEWLAEHVGVGAVPGSCFFREEVNHLIRFHFAKRDETLIAALDRLSELDVKVRKISI